MKILIDPNGVWCHVSPEKITELRAGSTITQWCALAEAFAHKPSALFYEDDGRIAHNGVQPSSLYEIDKPVQIGTDAARNWRGIPDCAVISFARGYRGFP